MEAINTHTLTLGLVPYRYGYVDAGNLLYPVAIERPPRLAQRPF